jgi:hypothetical protein
MTSTEINNAAIGSNASYITDFNVNSQVTDAASGDVEFRWTNSKAAKYLGYYKTIPELKMAIDAKALWTIGKGCKSNEFTMLVLYGITGFGKDTFNSILENMIRQYHIYGDAFAEIIRDEDDQLINIKPLDPGSITIVTDSKGLIKQYEQNSKNKPKKVFQPEEMFHLARNRIADEIHGTSVIEALQWVIDARNEAMTGYRKVLNRNVYPVRVHYLDTDVPSQINSYKNKVAQSKGQGEDIFVPKGSVEMELLAVPENSSLNPMPWIEMLKKYFYQGVGIPEIIIGGSQELTQTAAQIAYLAFEQQTEEDQLNIEQQVLLQLNLEIELEFPASLQNNLLSDDRKDGTQEQQLNQPSNLTPPGMGTAGIQ